VVVDSKCRAIWRRARVVGVLPGHGDRVALSEPLEVAGDDVADLDEAVLIRGVDAYGEDTGVGGQGARSPRGERDGSCGVGPVGGYLLSSPRFCGGF